MSRPRYYAVMYDVDPIEVRYWQKNRVTIINASFCEFMSALNHSILLILEQYPQIGAAARCLRDVTTRWRQLLSVCAGCIS